MSQSVSSCAKKTYFADEMKANQRLNKTLLFLALICLGQVSSLRAQSCGTILSQDQWKTLSEFQQSLDAHPLLLKKSEMLYVPLKVHIVGQDNKTGMMRSDHVLEAICTLNKNFAPVGFYFVLMPPFDYIYDSQLYATEQDAIYSSARANMIDGMYNLFFTGASSTLCGVYYPFPDAVFVIKSCAEPGESTLTHETGHFFSLPHTFSGWENGNTPSNIEYADGRNCRNAGDGFCDTKADYISGRWGCPYYKDLLDPAGIAFRPDSSLYMSYSMDACQSRFSNEQIAAMQNNLTNTRFGMAITKDEKLTETPQLIYPAKNDTIYNPNAVLFQWKKDPNAIAYMIQITRYGLWDQPYQSALVEDTFYTAKLFGGYPFDWRIKPISSYNTCLPYSESNTFYLDQRSAGINTLSNTGLSSTIYPNPAQSNEPIYIELPVNTSIQIMDMQGKYISEIPSKNHRYTEEIKLDKGIYFLQYHLNNAKQTSKLIVY